VKDDEAGGPGSNRLSERRGAERVDVEWAVDCGTDETFLYASIRNISEMGIFVQTLEPLEVGTRLTLRFAPPGHQEPFVLKGVVQWVNPVRPLSPSPNPGMGVRFVDLTLEQRERLVEAIHTIAYVGDTLQN
jgi:type IV pilus assembly protein PilZ